MQVSAYPELTLIKGLDGSKLYRAQQFQIQNLMALKALHQGNLTILDNSGDRWNGVKSF